MYCSVVVEIKNLDVVQFFGLKPGVDEPGSALEVARWDAQAINGTIMAGHYGFRKVGIITTENRNYRNLTTVKVERCGTP